MVFLRVHQSQWKNSKDHKNMNKQVIIIGASGHGKVIADIVLKSGDTI